jgi:glycosyltransferase involved in cell wall biosynthesis
MRKRLSDVFDITFLECVSINRFISPLNLLLYQLRYAFSVALSILKHKPDLVITSGFPHPEGLIAFAVSRMLRKDIILRETHWYWPNTLVARVLWPVHLWAVRKARLIIVPGRRSKQYLKLMGIPQYKIRIVPFYVSVLDVDAHAISVARNLKKELEGKFVILYLGRLIKKKGIDYLIKAFKILKENVNCCLIIAGDGPERRNLENLCRRMEIDDIIFTGVISETDKPGYFEAADVYVYPSITLVTPEEWGVGILEAMSVGKPVIATTATGCALDAIRNGANGYVVPERDAEALYKAIKTIANDANLRKRMGMESEKIIKSIFNYDCAVKAMIQAIGSVYKRKDSTRS